MTTDIDHLHRSHDVPGSPFAAKPVLSSEGCSKGVGTAHYTNVINPKEMAAYEAANFKNVKGVYKNCRGIWAAQWTDERGQRHTKYFNPKYFATEAEARHEAFRFKLHIAREVELRGGVQKRKNTPSSTPYRGEGNGVDNDKVVKPEGDQGFFTYQPLMTPSNGILGTSASSSTYIDNFLVQQQRFNEQALLLDMANYCHTDNNFNTTVYNPENQFPDNQLFFSSNIDGIYASMYPPPDLPLMLTDDLLPRGTSHCACGCGAIAISPARFACHHKCPTIDTQIQPNCKEESSSHNSLPLFPSSEQGEAFNFKNAVSTEDGSGSSAQSRTFVGNLDVSTSFPFASSWDYVSGAYSTYPSNNPTGAVVTSSSSDEDKASMFDQGNTTTLPLDQQQQQLSTPQMMGSASFQGITPIDCSNSASDC